jgi:hypothetical protein
MSALFFHPQAKLVIFWVTQRNMAVACGFSVFDKITNVSRPCCFLSIPRKLELIQKINSLLCDGTGLSILQKLVLLALFGDPAGETWILGVSCKVSK